MATSTQFTRMHAIQNWLHEARIEALATASERSIATDVEYFGDYADRDGSQAFLKDANISHQATSAAPASAQSY